MISLPLNNPVAFILSSCFRFLKKKSQQLRCLVAIFSIPFSTVFTRSNAMKSAIHIVQNFVIWKKPNNVFGVLVLLFSFEWKTGL